jgi:hypothetical protein
MYRIIILSLFMALSVAGKAAAQSREDKVRADRKKIESEGFWIYNDLARGFAEAKKTGKPLLVVLRCIPCEACVKLDDDLVNQDRRLRPLLEQFVRVRVVSTNGLDLSLFQFDYDQSFAVFMLNADRTIYGRHGTRSHRTLWADDVSIQGLAKALQGALDMHREYPKNSKALANKTGPAPDLASPEKYPLLRERYKPTLDYAGKVVPSCIHCHQIGDARRQVYRDRGESIPETLLFPYPHPKILGLILDPKERSTVIRVEPGSAAKEAGFERGDVILKLAGQPLLSIADVQWVLHRASATQEPLPAEVQRGHREVTLNLPLAKGWRQRDDLSWRVGSWGLRRMATGGMLLEDVPPGERKKAGISEQAMALRVRHLGGGSGPHGAAMRAGFRQRDVLVTFDGKDDLRRETDVLVHALNNHRSGEQVAVTVLRAGKRIELKLPIQK